MFHELKKINVAILLLLSSEKGNDIKLFLSYVTILFFLLSHEVRRVVRLGVVT